jgi:hypothetical protein
MTLSLGGPGLACSATRVRRLLAGELGEGERQRAAEHLESCSRCQRVQKEVLAEQGELERLLPFERFAAGVAERMARGRARPSRWRTAALSLAAGLAAAAALPLVLRLTAPPGEEGTRIKGAAGVRLFALEGGAVRPLAPGDEVPAGARLQAAVEPGGRRHAALALLDDDGVAVIYAGPARAGPLPQAFEWTGASREGTLVLVLSDDPIDGAGLAARLGRGAGSAGPEGRTELVLLKLRRR